MTHKFARILFYLIGAVGIAYGSIYLLRGSLMPFHAAFIAKTGPIQSANAERLLLMMMHVVGALFLIISTTIILLTALHWDHDTTRRCVACVTLAALLPIQVASWNVGNRTGVIETVMAFTCIAAVLGWRSHP